MKIKKTQEDYKIAYQIPGLGELETTVTLFMDGNRGRCRFNSPLSEQLILRSSVTAAKHWYWGGEVLGSLELDWRRIPYLKEYGVTIDTRFFRPSDEIIEGNTRELATKYHLKVKRRLYEILRDIMGNGSRSEITAIRRDSYSPSL